MSRLQVSLMLLLAGLTAIAARRAVACEARTVCIRWDTEIVDNGFGETLPLDATIPARGAKVHLLRPPPETPISTFLNEQGCLTFDSQFGYGHKLIVYAEAWVGWSDPEGPVRILAERSATVRDLVSGFYWLVDLHDVAPNDTVDRVITTEKTDPIAPLMALATETIYRLDNLGVILQENTQLRVRFLDYKANARHGLFDVIEVGPDSFREKFVVAHEIGHWLQTQWYGNFGDSDSGYPAQDQPCRFFATTTLGLEGQDIDFADTASHGIRSAEWSTKALREGFAHFIASAVFNEFSDPNIQNEDGIFRYYKSILVDEDFSVYEDFVNPETGNSRVSLADGTLGGSTKWTQSMCGQNDWPVDEVSSEIDWLRFFWRFLTREGTAPSLAQLLEFFQFVELNDDIYPIDKSNVWVRLRDAMGDSPAMQTFVSRFDEATCAMGVVNDDVCP